MRKAREQFIYVLNTFVTPISEYDIELWNFKGLKNLEKQTYMYMFTNLS